jgi:intracellular sulfur oxidation DsrE/DsrF family protein
MKKAVLFAAALALVLVFAAVSQTPKTPKHHVVFQLTEPEGSAWNLIYIHATNLQAAFANDGGTEVEIVFFGAGLNMLKKTNTAYADRLKQLSDSGIKLAACQNAMRLMHVTSDDLFPFHTEVDAGVAELTRKQEAGWSYIH